MTARLALVISNFGSGGAERVLSVLANHWAARNLEVTLISFSNPAADFYPLNENVRRVGLNLISPSRGPWRAVAQNVRRIRALRRAITTACPEVVIGFEDTTNILVVAATRGLRLPVIISQRVDPRFASIGRAWSFLRRRLYPLADAVVAQTATVADLLAAFVPRPRIDVIPNPVNAGRAASGYGVPPSGGGAQAGAAIGKTPIPPEKTVAAPAKDFGETSASSVEALCRAAGTPCPEAHSSVCLDGKHQVLSVGRLCRQKGHNLLLQAFARCHAAHPDWTLTIIGEGPERAALERLVSDLGLSDSVRLPGETLKTDGAYATAGLFVLSSIFEGFPNALCEAMAHGLPVISFDCPSGPSDIIRRETDGVLVPAGDVDALAAAMDRLMRNAALRADLGTRAAEGMRRFSTGNVLAQWERLLERVRAGNGVTGSD